MNILLTILAACIGWKIAEKCHLPAPAMLGSMLAVSIINIISNQMYLPLPVQIFTQAISGAFIGRQVLAKDLKNFHKLIKPFLLLVCMFTINTFAIGFVIAVVCHIDIITALLSCVAGGVTDMAIVAMNMNADAGTVAMLQTTRYIAIFLFFPYWIRFMCRKENNSSTDYLEAVPSCNKETFLGRLLPTRISRIVFTIIFSVIASYLGYLSDLPAATLVFPMFAVIAVNCTTSVCIVPPSIKILAQLLAGALVGASVKQSTFSSLSNSLIPVILLLASYWAVNYIYSKICVHCKWLDMKSAMFASAPGGATDMSLIASDLGADLTKIALIQVFRAAYAVSIMPLLIKIVSMYI